MAANVTREDVMASLEKVEHPEIAASLVELGMIQDVAVDGDLVRVAMALPTLGIPEIVRNMLVQSVQQVIESMNLQMEVEFFEMTEIAKQRFFAIAQARWKGSV